MKCVISLNVDVCWFILWMSILSGLKIFVFLFLTKRLNLVSKYFLQFIFWHYKLIICHSDSISHKFHLYAVFLCTEIYAN